MSSPDNEVDPYDKLRVIKLSIHSKVVANFLLQCHHEKIYHRDLIRIFIKMFSEQDPALLEFARKQFPRKKTKRELKNDKDMDVKERVYGHVFDHNDISSIYDILEEEYPVLDTEEDNPDEEMF
jgi:hypothetical protein